MNVQDYIDRLSRTRHAIDALVENVSSEQARWKPAPDRWSILEVVNHLADEERDDFRLRLDIALHQPDQLPPPIDPPRCALERQYNERELAPSLSQFLQERQNSLDWLSTLQEPDWDRTLELPHGSIRAGDILAAWAAHDLLHVRQLTKLHWEYLNRLSIPFKTEYAGQW